MTHFGVRQQYLEFCTMLISLFLLLDGFGDVVRLVQQDTALVFVGRFRLGLQQNGTELKTTCHYCHTNAHFFSKYEKMNAKFVITT